MSFFSTFVSTKKINKYEKRKTNMRRNFIKYARALKFFFTETQKEVRSAGLKY